MSEYRKKHAEAIEKKRGAAKASILPRLSAKQKAKHAAKVERRAALQGKTHKQKKAIKKEQSEKAKAIRKAGVEKSVARRVLQEKNQAAKAKKAQEKGKIAKRTRKARHTVRFRRPHTLRLPSAPRYPRRSTPGKNALDEFAILRFPLTTESAMKQIEASNTLTFIVDVRANKPSIKAAVEKLYQIKVVDVRTLIRPDNQKKAFVRLAADYDALDVANKMNIV